MCVCESVGSHTIHKLDSEIKSGATLGRERLQIKVSTNQQMEKKTTLIELSIV